MVSGRLDHLSCDLLRDLCKQRGNHREDAKEVLKTQLISMQDQRAISTQNSPMELGAPVTETAKRGPSPADVAGHLRGPTRALEKRRTRNAPRAASVAAKEAARARA